MICMITRTITITLLLAKDSSIAAYLRLADRALRARQLRFPVRPKKHVVKQHYFFHQIHVVKAQVDQLGFPTHQFSDLEAWQEIAAMQCVESSSAQGCGHGNFTAQVVSN